jgi:hypothetical protein
MWNPEAEEKKKRQAVEKALVGPLAGQGSEPSKVVEASELGGEKDTFLYYLENFKTSQAAVGLEKRQGTYVLVDKQCAECLPEPKKSWVREFLKSMAAKGRFIDESKHVGS